MGMRPHHMREPGPPAASRGTTMTRPISAPMAVPVLMAVRRGIGVAIGHVPRITHEADCGISTITQVTLLRSAGNRHTLALAGLLPHC
jgi:hypothetical protein